MFSSVRGLVVFLLEFEFALDGLLHALIVRVHLLLTQAKTSQTSLLVLFNTTTCQKASQEKKGRNRTDLASDLTGLGSETVKEDGCVLHAFGSGARKVRSKPDRRVLHVRVETGLDGHVVRGKDLLCCHLFLLLLSFKEKKKKKKFLSFGFLVLLRR